MSIRTRYMLMFVALLGVLTVLPRASVQAAETRSFQLLSIKCLRVHDSVGRDEPAIHFGGVKIWAGRDVVANTTINLESVAARTFTTQANLDLYEEDKWPSRDDYLGRHTVYTTEAGQGQHIATYSAGGSWYEITYEVK